MKQRTIEILIEILGRMIPFSCIICFFILIATTNEDTANGLTVIIFVPICIIYLILHYTLGEESPRASVKFKDTYKYGFKYKNFSELLEDVNNKLTTEGYSIKKEYSISEEEKVCFYAKPLNGNVLYLWIIADLVTYNKDNDKKINEYFDDFYENNIRTLEKHKVSTETCYLLCAKKYSFELEKMVREPMLNLNLAVGLLFSKKEIYIGRPRGINGKHDFEYMTSKFFQVVDATPIKKSKKHKKKKIKNTKE